MAKGNVDLDKSSDVWAELDSTNIAAIGGQRFFNHPTLGKCYARVIGIPGTRSPEVRDANLNVVSGGQVIELVRVYPNDGSSPYNVETVLSDDRKAGCTSLANDGDLTDAANTAQPRPESLVEEVAADDSVADTAPLQEPTPKPTGGEITKAQRKQLRKEKGE